MDSYDFQKQLSILKLQQLTGMLMEGIRTVFGSDSQHYCDELVSLSIFLASRALDLKNNG